MVRGFTLFMTPRVCLRSVVYFITIKINSLQLNSTITASVYGQISSVGDIITFIPSLLFSFSF